MRQVSHYDATTVAVQSESMPKGVRDPLPQREREIINALFALGNRATAEEIRARLVDPPSGSSVRVMLARLEKKGYVRHSQDGVRYVYSATESPDKAKRKALQRYVQTFFGGSLSQMVVSLVRQGSWTEEELERLSREIERARKEKGQ
jgi:predicted transcriptional regulator